MALPQKIKKFLEKQKIKYEILEHRTVYTAFDKSQTLKVSPKIVVKTLILRKDKDLIFVLIPADRKLDLKKIRKLGKKVKLVTERTIKNKIKGVKVGAIPPFGILWKAKTFADKILKKQKKIIVNGGNWQTSIKLSPKSLEKILPDLVWGNFSKRK